MPFPKANVIALRKLHKTKNNKRSAELLKLAKQRLDSHLVPLKVVRRLKGYYLKVLCTRHNKYFYIKDKSQLFKEYLGCGECTKTRSAQAMQKKMEEYETKVTGIPTKQKPILKSGKQTGRKITLDMIAQAKAEFYKSGKTATKLEIN